jgi:hypothetical protein
VRWWPSYRSDVLAGHKMIGFVMISPENVEVEKVTAALSTRARRRTGPQRLGCKIVFHSFIHSRRGRVPVTAKKTASDE